MPKRVLFLGPTGISKKAIMDRLAGYTPDTRRINPLTLDFEKEFLYEESIGGQDWFTFLDADHKFQAEMWRLMWDKAAERFNGHQGDVYLGLHGVITRGHFGVRCILDPVRVVQDFKPDIVITLIDNVFDQWWRTEQRSKGRKFMGRPTLEQLVSARRAELALGDCLANGASTQTRNYLFAVAHPLHCLYNLVYADKPNVLYLSFPISQPRRLLNPKAETGLSSDDAGVKAVNGFVKAAIDRTCASDSTVVLCPLMIDEKPLVELGRAALRQAKPPATITFDRAAHVWDLGDAIPDVQRLSEPYTGEPFPFPLDEVANAAALMETDVGWRDFRLVQQCRSLVVFSPTFKGAIDVASGVRREITEAVRQHRPVYIFQDATFDPGGKTKALYFDESSMGQGAGDDLIELADTPEDALQRAMEP